MDSTNLSQTEAKEWFSFAKTDLDVAKHLYDTFYPKPLEIICYHCQQSAEKSVKAIIAFLGSQGVFQRNMTYFYY